MEGWLLESCWCACAKNKMLPSYLRSSQMNSAHACGRRNERCVRPRTKLTGTFFSSGTFFYSSFGIYFAPSGIFELGRAERAEKSAGSTYKFKNRCKNDQIWPICLNNQGISDISSKNVPLSFVRGSNGSASKKRQISKMCRSV